MSDIPTWHERAMRHPDHQTGMVSEGMIRARMAEEIEDLRAEVERLQGLLRGLSRDVVEGIERLTREHDEARYFLAIFVHAHASNNAVPPHIEEQARKALEAKP